MFSPPSHPHSTPNPFLASSTSRPDIQQAWHPTSSSSTASSIAPSQLAMDPPRTVERKRKAYPYPGMGPQAEEGMFGPTPPRPETKYTSFTPMSGSKQTRDLQMDENMEMEIDPSTGLPTPVQTVKRDKVAAAASRARFAAIAPPASLIFSRTELDETSVGAAEQSRDAFPASPLSPPTPHRPRASTGHAGGGVLKGQSLTYMSSAYAGKGLGGMLSFEQDEMGRAESGSGLAGMHVDHPLGGTFGRKRRAGLTFAQQMGLLSSLASPTGPTLSGMSGVHPHLQDPSSSQLPASPDHDPFPPPAASHLSHDAQLSYTQPTSFNINPIHGPGVGIGAHTSARRAKGGRRIKSSVDSISLGSGPSASLGSCLFASHGDRNMTGLGGSKLDMRNSSANRKLGMTRSLEPAAKILLDDGGSNPFLVDETDETPMRQTSIGPASHAHHGQDVDMNDEYYQEQEVDSEEDGDYEIEIEEQPPLTSSLETSADSLGSPATTPRASFEEAGRGEAGMMDGVTTSTSTTPASLTPLGGSLVHGASMERTSSAGSASPSESFGNTSRASGTVEQVSPHDSGVINSIQPGFIRPFSHPHSSKKVWPRPTVGPTGGAADDEENPFLVGPGFKGKVMSAEERERKRLDKGVGEKETIFYVFRGTKTTFANPYYHLSSQSTPQSSKLDPGHLDFSPAPVPKPRLLWQDAHARASGQASGTGGSAGLGSGTAGRGVSEALTSGRQGRGETNGNQRMHLDADEDEDVDTDGQATSSLTAKPARRLLFGTATDQNTSTSGASTQSGNELNGIPSTQGVKHARDDGQDGHSAGTRERKRARVGLDRI